ncbi:uncharacterized protein LOC112086577 [Eutrema salsugineum]|uniref:uncharacterized protein LOC112086577 n=1 Tax=Eutrema salsugineum TaxID=72664 RepID=UPI000CED75DD|nr:uncharacterized protein LOC112086577 [Eutrema salsugineum]
MRKVIVVDGTHLQGKYKGTMLLATAQDGNFGIFPIAFGVVDSENDESWEWCFKQLSHVIPDDRGLAIISDRHRAIGNAIGKVYPLASRGICTYHLYKNILERFRGGESFRLVKRAANAYREYEFNAIFEEIRQVNPALHGYLQKADVRYWTRVYFNGDRYNFRTTNIAESINKVLSEATRWFAERRTDATLMKTVLTCGIDKLLEVKCKDLSVQQIDSHQFEIGHGASVNVVNLTMKTCTCRMFDLDKIPCVHALAAADAKKVSPIRLCHQYYHTTYLTNAYAASICPKDRQSPVPAEVESKICVLPMVRQPPGRPKKCMFKSATEIALTKKVPRKLPTCSKCGQTGHNVRTCTF